MRASFVASRNIISILYFFLRAEIVSEKSVKNFLSLMSTPIAVFDTVGVLLLKLTNVSMSVIGRLSTQKKPLSSKALSATLFPAPESPVKIIVKMEFFLDGLILLAL